MRRRTVFEKPMIEEHLVYGQRAYPLHEDSGHELREPVGDNQDELVAGLSLGERFQDVYSHVFERRSFRKLLERGLMRAQLDALTRAVAAPAGLVLDAKHLPSQYTVCRMV